MHLDKKWLPLNYPSIAYSASISIFVAVFIFAVASYFANFSNLGGNDNGRVSYSPADYLKAHPREWAAPATNGPLCGLYAASNALALIGVDCDTSAFLSRQYVSSLNGSTVDEVSRIITESGAHAWPLIHLSAIDLKLIDAPFIANVRGSASVERFNHWVVALPFEGGVEIYDGPQKPHTLKTAEFLAIWNGIGVCVTQDDVSPLPAIRLCRGGVFCAALLAAVLLKLLYDTFPAARLSGFGGQSAALLATTFALSCAGNSLFGDLANHSKGVSYATAGASKRTVRIATLQDVIQASQNPSTLLIDARRAEDFARGSIKGAFNIPVSASLWEIDQYLESIPRDTPIFVFCQSEHCAYDDLIASQLESLGFLDVYACEKGWAEYVANETAAQTLK